MAIRFEHQPAGVAVGMAAYLGGRGKYQQRQRKYMMDLYRDERKIQARRQEQFQGFKYQAMLEGARQTGYQQRMTQGRTWQLEDAATRREQQLADTTQQHEWDLGKEQRHANIALASSLPPIPENASSSQKDQLAKWARAIEEFAFSEQWDPTEEGTKDGIADLVSKYKTMVGSIPEAKPGADLNKRMGSIEDGNFVSVAEGGSPDYWLDDSGKPEESPTKAREAAAQQEAMEGYQTELDRLREVLAKLGQQRHDAKKAEMTADDPTKVTTYVSELDEWIEKTKDWIKQHKATKPGGTTTGAPIPGGGATKVVTNPDGSKSVVPQEPGQQPAPQPASKPHPYADDNPTTTGWEIDEMFAESGDHPQPIPASEVEAPPSQLSDRLTAIAAGATPEAQQQWKREAAETARAEEQERRRGLVTDKAKGRRSQRHSRMGIAEPFSFTGAGTSVAGAQQPQAALDPRQMRPGQAFVAPDGSRRGFDPAQLAEQMGLDQPQPAVSKGYRFSPEQSEFWTLRDKMERGGQQLTPAEARRYEQLKRHFEAMRKNSTQPQ